MDHDLFFSPGPFTLQAYLDFDWDEDRRLYGII